MSIRCTQMSRKHCGWVHAHQHAVSYPPSSATRSPSLKLAFKHTAHARHTHGTHTAHAHARHTHGTRTAHDKEGMRTHVRARAHTHTAHGVNNHTAHTAHTHTHTRPTHTRHTHTAHDPRPHGQSQIRSKWAKIWCWGQNTSRIKY